MNNRKVEKAKNIMKKILKYSIVFAIFGLIGYYAYESRRTTKLEKAARAFLDDGGYNQALTLYNQLITEDQKNTYLRLQRAKVYERLGDFHSAIDEINYIIRNYEYLGQEFYTYFTWRASCYAKLFDYKNAINSMDTAIAVSEPESDNFYQRAELKILISDYEGSISDYSKCIELDSSDIYAYQYLASAKTSISDYRGAIAILKKALALDSNDCNILSDITDLQLILGENDAALLTLERTLLKYPESSRFHEAKGDLLMSTNRYNEALESYNRAIQLNPKDASLYYHRGIIYKKIGNEKESKLNLLKALHLGYYPAGNKL